MATTLYLEEQEYQGIKLRLIKRNYSGYKAKRFTINGTNQNVWIPNKHLTPSGKLLPGENLYYIFNAARNQLKIAGAVWQTNFSNYNQ